MGQTEKISSGENINPTKPERACVCVFVCVCEMQVHTLTRH